MTDLTAKLAEIVREEQAREAAIELLAEHAASGADSADLERQLGLEANVARAAFEPISDEMQARFAAAIQASLPAAAPVKSIAPRWPRIALLLGPVVAAAAALALLLWPSGLPPLERYELEVSGAVALTRGLPGAAISGFRRPSSVGP